MKTKKLITMILLSLTIAVMAAPFIASAEASTEPDPICGP